MSTLSQNRGKERTHDHDPNTQQTLCPQRNREALVNTSQLAQNPHSVRTLAGLKTSIINRFLSFDNRVRPTAGHTSRHHPEVWRQTYPTPRSTQRVLPRRPALMPCLVKTCLDIKKQNPRRSTSSHPQENYPNTTASSLLCKKANDHVISLKR